MTIPISIDNAEHYLWGEQCDGWHLAKSPVLSVIQERVPPGCAEMMHYHHKAEQFFYILSGEAQLEVEGKIHSLSAQQGLHVKAGLRHQLANRSEQELVFLVISTPPSHGDKTLVE